MHKLFKYDVTVMKLSCLIVFIVICTDNFWKADMEQFYNKKCHHLAFDFLITLTCCVCRSYKLRIWSDCWRWVVCL